MITTLVLQAIFTLLNLFFAMLHFPQVTTLPTIIGFDIDGALVAGFGYFYSFIGAFWPFAYVWYAFLTLLGYYILKNTALKFILGNRTPGVT